MKSATRYKNNKKGDKCLNCMNPMDENENFCSICGQVNDVRPLNLKHFFSEFFSSFFSFNTRFFNTILPLLFKPGKVAMDYIRGKRKKYTSPFQLYLQTSIVFFLIIGLISTIQKYKKDDIVIENLRTTDNLEFQEDIIENQAYYKSLIDERLDSIISNTNSYDQIRNAKGTLKDSLTNTIVIKAMQLVVPSYQSLLDEDHSSMDIKNNAELITAHSNYEKHTRSHLKQLLGNDKVFEYSSPVQISLPDTIMGYSITKLNRFIKYASKNPKKSTVKALRELDYPHSKANIYWYKKALDFEKMQTSKEFRKSYYQSIISKITFALFFLLPLLTVVFSFFYFRNNYTYSEHLVVVFYTQAMFLILLLIGLILDAIFDTDLFSLGAVFIFTIYFYKTLRNVYQEGRIITILKYFVICIFYFIFLFLGGALLLLLSFFIM